MNFREALISTYCENPCQVLPTAIWKILAQVESLQTAVELENGECSLLRASNESDLLVYWTKDRKAETVFFEQHDNPSLALVHNDYLVSFPWDPFTHREAYFRILYKHIDQEGKKPLPKGFSIVEVNTQNEAQKVSDLISKCYQDLHPGVDEVTNWMKHPVFEPECWIWVMDDEKGVPAGLGIAEVDRTVSEGSLEWIQVLPEYQGRGIGKCMVWELQHRMDPWVKFITVSGQVDNQTNPQALYRACGFEGKDLWWVFRKD